MSGTHRVLPTVKVCGITRAEDGERALALGADYLGIICHAPSPRAVDRETARDLCNRFPAGRRVFVDVNTGTDELDDYGDLGFDRFQIHCDYDAALVAVAAWSGIVGREHLWLAPRIPPDEDFPEVVLEFCDTIVLDTYSASQHGGTGTTGDWGRFREWQARYPQAQFILAGGLNPGNVNAALRETEATFIDVNSGVEAAPGKKDPQKLEALFHHLREG